MSATPASQSCKNCGSVEQVQEHHVDYEEGVTVLLCAECHRGVHYGRIRPDLKPKARRASNMGTQITIPADLFRRLNRLFEPFGLSPYEMVPIIVRAELDKRCPEGQEDLVREDTLRGWLGSD